MQYKKNRKKSVITIFLLLAFAASLVISLPGTHAQAPTLKTYAFIGASPNPIGVGQQSLIHVGITQAAGDVTQGWKGLTVSVTRPDGTNETLGPFSTDSTGGTVTLYTPTQVGTYKFQTIFPQQVNPVTFFSLENGATILNGTVLLASTSDIINLVVQENPLPNYPSHPLPTEYWSRPIDPQLREWYAIAGNWLTRPPNAFAPYNQGPETAHILWAKPLTAGGLTGGVLGDLGNQGQVSHETGDAYEGKFQNSVILNGILYYNRMPVTFTGSFQPQNGIFAVDLHSGKELWFRNNTILSFGQTFYFDSFNYDGVYNYLWDASAGSTWNAYDPFTSEWLYSMTNVPSGTQYYGPNGEILILQIDTNARWMALWNSTASGQQGLTLPGDFGSWARFVHGQTWNASNPKSYSWNVTIPAGLTISGGLFGNALKVYPDRVVALGFNLTQVNVWALNLNPEQRGQLLFNKVWQAPSEWLNGSNTIHYTGATNDAANGTIAVWDKELRKHYGFSTATGDYQWETNSEHYLNAYGFGNVEHTWYFAYGKLYSTGVSGIVYCYDLTNGKTLWTYNMTDPFNQVETTGNYWWAWITMISDGKVYVGHVEHSAEMPLPRGAPYVCLNATTGEQIWRADGLFRQTRWGGAAIMGDSIIATMDTYDQRIYAIGKGPSDITITASPTVSTFNSGVLIQGYVTDVSPGLKDDALTARFPKGVPAVSDASMSEWMLFVYKQFEHPSNITGVPVSLDVLDANGNFRNIGKTTSDSSGYFNFQWTPDIEGKYSVMATFTGSNAYYGAHAQTAISVTSAPSPTATSAPPTSMTDQYFIPAVVAIIVVIIIVGVVLALMLRRRP